MKQVKQNHNYIFECWSIKIYPKSHRYLVFAVKSGTKLLCYAAAVRRQFFGKWLHLNMRRAQAVQGHQARDEGWKQLPSSHVVCSTSCHTKQKLLGAAHIDCRITNFVLKSPQPMSKKIGLRNFSPMLKVPLSKGAFNDYVDKKGSKKTLFLST